MARVRGVKAQRGAGALVGALAGIALLTAACTTPPPDPTSTTTTGTTPARSIAWSPCGEPKLECASVPVPMDWMAPTGPTITLAVIRHKASKPDQRIGTLFINPGGPGDTGVGLVKGAADDLDAWGGGRFDIVSWDPRGTYGSSPITCFKDDAAAAAFWKDVRIPYTPAESDAYAQRMLDLAQRCKDVMGPLLAHVSTADTARDLDALRAGVGEDEITYVGLSYGTVLGQTYLNLFPQHIRAMMLDSVVDGVSFTTSAEVRSMNSASSADDVFDQFAALCDDAGPARCALAGHPGQSAAQRVDTIFARLRAGPIPAPTSDPPGQLGYTDFQLASFAALRNPALWPAWAQKLDAAAEGDGSALETDARLWLTPSAWAEVTKSAAISCLDGPVTTPVTQWASVMPGFTAAGRWSGAVQAWWTWAPCAASRPVTSDDRYAGPWGARTDVPVLVVNTLHDPNTSYANAVAVTKRLGNAVLLTHSGYGHVTSNDVSSCVEKARVAYLVDLRTPPPGTVCAPDAQPFS